ncbi:MAG: PIN domain-containing protein [Pseudonocardiales bacterium]|nr:PIN domain-containing protein [Pseudonocardiales bacterium]
MSSVDVILDAGALIAVERGSNYLSAVGDESGAAGRLVVPGPVLAQVWRGGGRQALLSRFLKLPIVVVDVLNQSLWEATGELCGLAGTSDVVDAAVIICARARQSRVVITSDPDDLRAIDPGLTYLVP